MCCENALVCLLEIIFLICCWQSAKAKERGMFSVRNGAVCKVEANQAGADHHSDNDAVIIETPNMANC